MLSNIKINETINENIINEILKIYIAQIILKMFQLV